MLTYDVVLCDHCDLIKYELISMYNDNEMKVLKN